MFLLGQHVDTVFPVLTDAILVVTPVAPDATNRCRHVAELAWTVSNATVSDTARISRQLNGGSWIVRTTVPLTDLAFSEEITQLNPTAPELYRYRVEALNEGVDVKSTLDSNQESLSCPI